MNNETQGLQPLDVASRLAIAYLALPHFIFFLGWFSPVIGVPLAALLMTALLPLLKVDRGAPAFRASLAVVVISLVVATGWSVLGGAGHFVYANLDWHTRDAVLRDLVVSAWPPSYGEVQGRELILRTPVAYYLPAAWLGKVFGLRLADLFLFLWTALGVFLFFLNALSRARTGRHILIGLAVIVFFSGMEVLGTERYFIDRPGLTEHLEWWTRVFQYSANTTQLFWVPNHALPGWLLTALIYRHWRSPDFVKVAPIPFALTVLWSPLVTIGLAPFAILIIAYSIRHNTWRSGLSPWCWLGAVATFSVTSYYILLDVGGIRSGSTVAGAPSLDGFVMLYLKFALLEFGLLALAIALIRRDVLLMLALLILLVLPFYRFGPGNDLVMRASIPALMALCLVAMDALSQFEWRADPKRVVPLLFCLSFGSITAIHEIARSLLFSRWPPQLQRNLIEVSRGAPPHYVGRLNGVLSRALRSPDRVPGFTIEK